MDCAEVIYVYLFKLDFILLILSLTPKCSHQGTFNRILEIKYSEKTFGWNEWSFQEAYLSNISKCQPILPMAFWVFCWFQNYHQVTYSQKPEYNLILIVCVSNDNDSISNSISKNIKTNNTIRPQLVNITLLNVMWHTDDHP